MASIQEAFALAVRHHQAGALTQAEQLYRQILQIDPFHFQALHLLGVAACQTGRYDMADGCIRQSLSLQPQQPEAYINLGNVYKQQGRLDEAVSCYRQAVLLKPGFAEAYNNLGVALVEQGRLDEAVVCYRQALLLEPGDAGTHNNLGNALRQQGRLDEAVACHRQVLRLHPGSAEGHNNLGVALAGQGRLDDAVACYRQALLLKPGYARAHSNLGAALAEQGRLDDAVACYRQALVLEPGDAGTHNNLGNALREQGRLGEAVACLHQALLLNPGFSQAHTNLGNALRQQGRLDEAVSCYRQALLLKPGFSRAHNNLGVALAEQGRLDEAVSCYRQALLLNPNDADAHYGLSLALLLQGDFAQGWPEYEWRRRCHGALFRPFLQPPWDGAPLAGRTLLLYAEQGLGDTLQFIRYASRIPRDGGRLVVECQPPLLRLLSGLPGIDQFVPRGAPPPDFDVQAPLLSLPGIFRTSLASIPADIPYLSADADRVEHWRRELEPLGGFKVGIAWQGSSEHKKNRQRSVPLVRFAALGEIAGVRLCSLQVGPGAEQMTEANFPVRDLGSRFADFADTAAAVRNLDLVVCVDTSVAHLAVALGKPVWLALPFVPDWRWMLERQDSPWYPTMRLFRQEWPGDWDGVFARLADGLRQLVQQAT